MKMMGERCVMRQLSKSSEYCEVVISWQMEWLAYSTRRRMGGACKIKI